MRIVLIGPPGVGKGTQGQRLATTTGATHLATGELVRSEIKAGTPIGRKIQSYNDRGELVPDEIIVGLIKPYLTTTESWILDGFPRDEAQARALDRVLEETGVGLDRVIVLEAPDEELITRLLGRRQSVATGKTYHLTFDPPPASDPGPLVQRVDDSPDDIRRRLEVYHSQTEPLKQYYAKRGLLTQIDASGSMDETTEAILQAVKGIQ
jgi:adenylate kinase